MRWLFDWRYWFRYHDSLGIMLGDRCPWGRWDNGDYSNKKHLTNTTTTCGIHVFSKVSQLVDVYGWLRNPLHCPTKKWDTCGTEENLNLFFLLSIMARNIGNSNNASGSGLNANALISKSKFWDERVDEFSSNLNTNNAFCDDDGTRFFVMKRSKGDFSKTSPFLIEKAINSIVGNSKSIIKNFDHVSFLLNYKATNKQQIWRNAPNLPIFQ